MHSCLDFVNAIFQSQYLFSNRIINLNSYPKDSSIGQIISKL
jgi:hypothetical protein